MRSRRGPDSRGETIVVDMNDRTAAIADQEDAVMLTVRMGVDDISVRTFDPTGEVRADKQVQNPVDAVGCNPAPLLARYRFGDIIRRSRTRKAGQSVENRGPHRCPLLPGASHRGFRCLSERSTLMKDMHMSHEVDLGVRRAGGKTADQSFTPKAERSPVG